MKEHAPHKHDPTSWLLDSVEKYTKTIGVCLHAYKETPTCLRDDCVYCDMVRAYLTLRHSNGAPPSTKGDKSKTTE